MDPGAGATFGSASDRTLVLPEPSMNDTRQYENPLIKRYASARMGFVFSPQFKFQTWRKLWILLAEAEKELGLPMAETKSLSKF